MNEDMNENGEPKNGTNGVIPTLATTTTLSPLERPAEPQVENASALRVVARRELARTQIVMRDGRRYCRRRHDSPFGWHPPASQHDTRGGELPCLTCVRHRDAKLALEEGLVDAVSPLLAASMRVGDHVVGALFRDALSGFVTKPPPSWVTWDPDRIERVENWICAHLREHWMTAHGSFEAAEHMVVVAYEGGHLDAGVAEDRANPGAPYSQERGRATESALVAAARLSEMLPHDFNVSATTVERGFAFYSPTSHALFDVLDDGSVFYSSTPAILPRRDWNLDALTPESVRRACQRLRRCGMRRNRQPLETTEVVRRERLAAR